MTTDNAGDGCAVAEECEGSRAREALDARRERMTTGTTNDGATLEIAYHEAGHAAMALVLRRPFSHATALESGDELGSVEFGPLAVSLDSWCRGCLERLDWRRVHWLEREIMIVAAGNEARLLAGIKEKAGTDDADRAQAMNLAPYLTRSGPESEALVSVLTMRARRILKGNWPLVEAIAKALLDKGTIRFREACRLRKEAQAANPLAARPGPTVWPDQELLETRPGAKGDTQCLYLCR